MVIEFTRDPGDRRVKLLDRLRHLGQRGGGFDAIRAEQSTEGGRFDAILLLDMRRECEVTLTRGLHRRRDRSLPARTTAIERRTGHQERGRMR